MNSDENVEARMQKLYASKYGAGPFIPEKLRLATEEAHRAKLLGISLIEDKNATPSSFGTKQFNDKLDVAGSRVLSGNIDGWRTTRCVESPATDSDNQSRCA